MQSYFAGRQGRSWLGLARRGGAGRGSSGRGAAGKAKARYGRLGTAWWGWAEQVRSRWGVAWRGFAGKSIWKTNPRLKMPGVLLSWFTGSYVSPFAKDASPAVGFSHRVLNRGVGTMDNAKHHELQRLKMFRHFQPRSLTERRTAGQRFGAAGKCKSLSKAEQRKIEKRLRSEGRLLR